MVKKAKEETPISFDPPEHSSIVMHTVKLDSRAGTLMVPWPSVFQPTHAEVLHHRIVSNQQPTGYLVGPVFQKEEGQREVTLKIQIIKDNTPLPPGSFYLGSFSDSFMSPAFYMCHVILLEANWA
jgi:hypothetical protein